MARATLADIWFEKTCFVRMPGTSIIITPPLFLCHLFELPLHGVQHHCHLSAFRMCHAITLLFASYSMRFCLSVIGLGCVL